jgi:hypothetical protein
MAQLPHDIPEPPALPGTPNEIQYTGPYCVPVDCRDYCILALLDYFGVKSGAEHSVYVSDAWRAFAEALVAFYGEEFWMKELASYVSKM